MSAETLAEFRAFMAEQERKRQNPGLHVRAARRLAAPRRRTVVVADPRPETSQVAHPVARRSLVVLGSLVLGTGLGTGAATAYWMTGGSGSGAATTGTATAIAVSPGTVSGTPLHPGLTADGTSAGGDLVVRVTNPNPFKVSVALTPDGAATGCTTPDVAFSGGTFTVEANTVEPVARTVRHSVGMGTSASSDCQGKTINVPVTATATSTTN